VCIDDGAAQAVSNRGRSLLPPGIIAVNGTFASQDLVSVVDRQGVEISRGITTYSSDEITKIMGHHSSAIIDILGFTRGEAVLHHLNIILV